MKHIKIHKRISLLLCILIAFLASGCDISSLINKNNTPISKSQLVLGTVCTITIYDSKDTSILTKCFSELEILENIFSINKPNTEVDEINNSAGKSPVKISSDTFTVLEKGLYYSNISNGALDITIGPLVKLWGIGTDNAKVPSESEINNVKSLVNYKNLILDSNSKTAYLEKAGMIIDLGAIAKGYAADKVKAILESNNVSSAIIDLGGNIFALGENITKNTDWKIGIQDPENSRGDYIGYLTVNNKSLVTSGIYERYLEKDGKRYHHILSPFTGLPYDNDILSVSIISDKSIDGDSLSTTIFALGREKGMSLINSIDNIDAIIITKNHDIYLSKNISKTFTVTDKKNYKLVE